jgi:LysR family nitrogen assimilation transcriptional regulator
MKLRQLRYFIRVMETGNITRAAEQLNLAQTALGIQIRNLEDSLGTELLERHSRGVTPTRAGRLLYERAQDILRRIDETQRDIASLSTDKMTVRLGATPSILKLIGTDLIVSATDALPNLQLHVVEQLSFVLLDSLNRGELDYILAYDAADMPGLKRYPLMEEDLLHVSAPQAGEHPGDITFRESMARDLALASSRDTISQLLHSIASRLSIQVNVAYQVQSMESIKRLIQHGVADSVMPFGTVQQQISTGEFVARQIVQPHVRRTLYLMSAADRRPLADERPFLGFIEEMVRALRAAIGPYAHEIDRPPLV